MSTAPKKTFRKRRLFPRTIEEALKDATKPLMDKQGKLYAALLRDWPHIVGPERAAVTRPERLQFPPTQGTGATLHLEVRPAAAPELAYVTGQILDQCARHFGYRAIERIVLHPTHGLFDTEEKPAPAPAQKPSTTTIAANVPKEMRAVLERIGGHVNKKDSTE